MIFESLHVKFKKVCARGGAQAPSLFIRRRLSIDHLFER
jgi:hypothetical protein